MGSSEAGVRDLPVTIDRSNSRATSLHDVSLQLQGLRDLWDERDRRYDDRFEQLVLHINEKFLAAEKAVLKQEEIQRNHDVQANGLQKRLDEQTALSLSRVEAMSLFGQQREWLDRVERDARVAIGALQASRNEIAGRDAHTVLTRDRDQWVISLIVAILVSVLVPIVTKLLTMGVHQ